MRYIILLTSLFLFACKDSTTSSDKEKTTKIDPTVLVDKNTSPDSLDNPTTLSINALPVSGDLGRITFSRNDSTFFYYDLKPGTGKIKLNGKEYSFDLFVFDGLKNTYTFSGKDLKIEAANGVFKENKGEDCGYGSYPGVKVTLGGAELFLENMQVQDCPAY